MDDMLKTWGNIFAGLFWAAIVAIFVTGFVTTGEFVVRKIQEYEAAPTKKSDCPCKEESCAPCAMEKRLAREEQRDPETLREPSIGLPKSCRVRNPVNKVDHTGLNVAACIETSARYQGVRSLRGFTDRQSREKTIGYPEATAIALNREAKSGCDFRFRQYDGKEFAEWIKATLDVGEVPCVTWVGPSKHYSHPIQTMVCVLHLDPSDQDETLLRDALECDIMPCVTYSDKQPRACIYDPNYPDEVEWMSRDAFLKRAAGTNGSDGVVTIERKESP